MNNGWIDVLVFAAIAGFLWLRLRKSLGETKEGGPPPLDLPQIFSNQPIATPPNDVANHVTHDVADDELAAKTPPALRDQLPNYNVVSSATAHQQLGALLSVYQAFNPLEFLSGAKRALPLIVHAYAAGDQTVLDKLLVADVAKDFAQNCRPHRTLPYLCARG
jgi:predicted lipid-binding transport protein (Tim44 family)